MPDVKVLVALPSGLSENTWTCRDVPAEVLEEITQLCTELDPANYGKVLRMLMPYRAIDA